MYLQYLASHTTQKFSALNKIMRDNVTGKSRLTQFYTLIRAIKLKTRALFGVSIAWMLHDLIDYAPNNHRLTWIQGNSESLHSHLTQQILGLVFAAPAYIFCLRWVSPWIQRDRKTIQFISFILLSILYVIQWWVDQGINKACVRYDVLKHRHQGKVHQLRQRIVVIILMGGLCTY